MPAGDEHRPRVRSWITPKAAKGGAGAIAGRACTPSRRSRPGRWSRPKAATSQTARPSRACPMRSGNSAFPIAADCFLAALVPGEYDGVLMRINHSCQPNVGMGGNVLLVSMRDIAADEELTIDYALFLGDPGFAMDCRCGTAACRGVVRGTDWMHAGLQARYRGWLSWWLQQKIAQSPDQPSR